MKTIYNISPIKRTRVLLGRRRREYESGLPDKVLFLFETKIDKDGVLHPVQLTNTELWRKAQANGFASKGIFQKYLDQLVTAGLVVHQGRYYHIKHATMSWELTKNYPPTCLNVEDEKGLSEALQNGFVWVLSWYVDMLRGLVKIEDKSKAREHVGLFFSISPMESVLAMLAQVIWNHRKKVPLDSLDTTLLSVSLRKKDGRFVFASPRKDWRARRAS